jgi:hypothetical protein
MPPERLSMEKSAQFGRVGDTGARVAPEWKVEGESGMALFGCSAQAASGAQKWPGVITNKTARLTPAARSGYLRSET